MKTIDKIKICLLYFISVWFVVITIGFITYGKFCIEIRFLATGIALIAAPILAFKEKEN